MSLYVKLELTQEARRVLANLRELQGKVLLAIARETDVQHQLTIGHIQEKRLSADKFSPPRPPEDGILRHVSGNLKRSIRASKASVIGTSVVSSIGTNVKYAGIHEYGGTTKPHVINPKKRKALAFTIGGNTLVRRSVNHPGSSIPRRAPIYRGIVDRFPNYVSALSKAVLTAARSNQ